MTIKEAAVWPVNANGEIVLQLGTGSQTITGFLPHDKLPTDTSTNKIVINFPASASLTGIVSTEARQLQVREVTAAGAITMNATDDVILVNKTSGAATIVNLTAGTNGRRIQVKDKKADAATNNITLTANGAETIDGSATFVINVNRQAVTLVFKNTEWSVI